MAKRSSVKKTSTRDKCSTPFCENDAVCATKCNTCYVVERYWAKKTVAQRAERRRNLSKYQARMEAFTSPRLHLATYAGSKVK